MNKVFVYGTLRRGGSNHSYLSGLDCIDSECQGVVRYWKDGYSFPFAKRQDGMKIYGELYTVDDLTFKRLDYLEGHPNFYKREEVEVLGCDGSKHRAWIYLHNKN